MKKKRRPEMLAMLYSNPFTYTLTFRPYPDSVKTAIGPKTTI